MLKMVLENLEGLSEAQQAFYAKSDDGKFRLQLEGYEDPKGLKSALESERTARKEFEKKLKSYGDLSPEDAARLAALRAKLGDDEELSALRDGKLTLDEIVGKRSERMKKDYEDRLKAAQAETAAEKETVSKLKQGKTKASLREAATEAGMHRGAVDDAVMFAMANGCTVSEEDGETVLGENGEPVIGKSGKPLGFLEFFESLHEKKAHWWPASGTGTGAPGTQRRNVPGTMKRAQYNGLPPAEQARIALDKTIRIVD